MVHVAWEETDVPAGSLSLHVRRMVEPKAPPIVLLHGLGVAGAVWQAFARRLAPRYAAVAPDLRGHGASDTPPSGYEPADYARDLTALFDGFVARPAPVLGHSLGSLVALALADLRPDLVSALVLVDPPVDPEHRNGDVRQVFQLRHEHARALEEYLLASNPGGGKLLAESLARMFRQASDAAFEAMLTGPAGFPEAWERARRVDRPTLVVQADPDAGGVLGAAAAERFTAALPRGSLLKIEGADHAVHASQPARLAGGVLAFLDEAQVRGPGGVSLPDGRRPGTS